MTQTDDTSPNSILGDSSPSPNPTANPTPSTNPDPNGVSNDLIHSKRDASIDVYRGLTIILMVWVNTTRSYENIPWWARHIDGYGITFVDVIAPMFLFTIALTYRANLAKKIQKDGRFNAYNHNMRRYTSLMGIGFIIVLLYLGKGGNVFDKWDTLQCIGFSGLVFLLVAERSTFFRLIIALGGLSVYLLVTEALPVNFQNDLARSWTGGFIGAFGWLLLLTLSSVLADGIQKQRQKEYFLLGGIILAILGIILNNFWPIHKRYVSTSFVVITVGLASIVYFVVYYLTEKKHLHQSEPWGKKIFEKILTPFARNSLLIYLIAGIIMYIGEITLSYSIPGILAFFLGIGNLVFCWGIATFLHKKGWYFKL